MATSGKHWVTQPDQCKDPVVDKSGFGALPPITVIDLFKQTVEKHGDCNAMALKRPVAVRIKFSCVYLLHLFTVPCGTV